MPMPPVEVGDWENSAEKGVRFWLHTHESSSCCEVAVSFIKDHIPRARKMTHLVKGLSRKYKDLGLDPQNP